MYAFTCWGEGTGLSSQRVAHIARASLSASYSGESRLNTCTMFLTETWNLGSGDLIIQFFSIVTS